MKRPMIILPFITFIVLNLSATAEYNSLHADPSFKAETVTMVIEDNTRQRSILIKVYLPATNAPSPVILFSHGLGGSRDNNPYLGNHWSARGYVVVFVQHPGSDEGVWKNENRRNRMGAMKKAASGKNYQLRVVDIPTVLDQLEIWNNASGHILAGRMALDHIGMSGHSFGARTTQAVSGEHIRGKPLFTDKRIKAAIAFSPSSPKRGTPEAAFGSVKTPWMLMTGTKDLSMIGATDLEARLAVYPALPKGDKYELVLYNAEHSAFSDRSLPGETEERNPNHHRAILALSTAFWDVYLKEDADAKEWLTSSDVKSVLESKDRWQTK